MNVGAKEERPSGSFVEFLRKYGQKHPPRMCSRDSDDIAGWARSFRTKLDELRGSVPDRVERDVEIVESVELETHTRHLLRIPVNEFCDLPAYLLIPRGVEKTQKRPGLLALHGHATYGMESIAGLDNPETREFPTRNYGRKAVEGGFVVMIPAWWGFPGRDRHAELIGSRDKCNVIQMAAGMYGLNVLSLHIQDAQAALDALIRCGQVDADRIGCMGNSYGGRMSMWAAVFDQRIKACVASGCMNTFRERSLKLSSCGIQYFPGLLQYGDVADVFALIAPRALQLMAGEKDHLLNEADREEMYETLRRVYRALGAEENLDYALHPEGHVFIWELAERFLRKHLS